MRGDVGDELRQQLDAFTALAERLNMSPLERLGILGFDEGTRDDIPTATAALDAEQRLGLQRRLLYIVPLMRRALSNSGGT